MHCVIISSSNSSQDVGYFCPDLETRQARYRDKEASPSHPARDPGFKSRPTSVLFCVASQDPRKGADRTGELDLGLHCTNHLLCREARCLVLSGFPSSCPLHIDIVSDQLAYASIKEERGHGVTSKGSQ